MAEDNIYVEPSIVCKSISGEEDENGNYKFEVEASNENLDLQNQYTLQSALKKSEEYFITNGVISDDHQHKTRNPDGSVETHKEKIIGEPISVRFDPKTKQTFVKGILYSGIEAAKPYIELLKNKSRLVKASIGGIMPKIKHNPDGTETVTSFMWNDLALTCSPVNWTVGGAKFAKSMTMVDFCKSLEAGTGTDAATMTNGRSLQSEDIEDETKKILDVTDGNITGDDEEDDLKKADKKAIKKCITAIDNGELITKGDITTFLMNEGFDSDKAKETTLEIIYQGGTRMKKSHFSSTIDELLKSYDSSDEEDIQKSQKDSEDEEAADENDDTLFDDEEDEEDSESKDDVKKCAVKKSVDEFDGDYLDATDLMKSMGETVDELKAENEALKKSLAEVQDNMIQVTKSFGDYLKTPETRKSVLAKSVDSVVAGTSSGPAKRPSNADFDVLKSCLVKAVQKKEIGLEEVQFYNSEFQKSMKGIKVDPATWNKICSIVKDNR